jgi:hypothetical protein
MNRDTLYGIQAVSVQQDCWSTNIIDYKLKFYYYLSLMCDRTWIYFMEKSALIKYITTKCSKIYNNYASQ